jgi:hypothetical protein
MITSIDKWLTSLVISTMERPQFLDGLTVEFLVDYISFTNTEKEWSIIERKVQKRLIASELRKLERRLKVYSIQYVTGNIWFWRID